MTLMMINVCVFCGKNKSKALDVCELCAKTPATHKEKMHSIVLCYSEGEPYLNFLELEEIEKFRQEIIQGRRLYISPSTISNAEEAYYNVNLLKSGQVMDYFPRKLSPLMVTVLIILTIAIIFGL